MCSVKIYRESQNPCPIRCYNLHSPIGQGIWNNPYLEWRKQPWAWPCWRAWPGSWPARSGCRTGLARSTWGGNLSVCVSLISKPGLLESIFRQKSGNIYLCISGSVRFIISTCEFWFWLAEFKIYPLNKSQILAWQQYIFAQLSIHQYCKIILAMNNL